MNIKNIVRLGAIAIIQGNIKVLHNSKYSVLNKIPIVFHDESNYDYPIIKELAEAFEGPRTCSGKNTELYITFSATIENEIRRIDKKGKNQTNPILQTTIY